MLQCLKYLAEAICRALGGRGGEELLHQSAPGPASRAYALGGEECVAVGRSRPTGLVTGRHARPRRGGYQRPRAAAVAVHKGRSSNGAAGRGPSRMGAGVVREATVGSGGARRPAEGGGRR